MEARGSIMVMNVSAASVRMQVLTWHHGKVECWHGFSAKTSVDAASWQRRVLVQLHCKDKC